MEKKITKFQIIEIFGILFGVLISVFGLVISIFAHHSASDSNNIAMRSVEPYLDIGLYTALLPCKNSSKNEDNIKDFQYKCSINGKRGLKITNLGQGVADTIFWILPQQKSNY